MNDKVTTKLQGGLCNYLFQIAAAYAYGLKHGKTPVFSLQNSTVVHKSALDYSNDILRNITFTEDVSFKSGFSEQGFHYTEIPFINGNVSLLGYFQSEKYFKEYEVEIRDLFSCPDFIKSKMVETYPDIQEESTCSMHIRRGDYVRLPNHHPTQNVAYYMKGLKKMPKNCKVFVFSDDIEWCKSNFPDMGDRFVYVEGQTDVEDLYLMSMCKHNIIANSTFSWWASWLNENQDKTIVAPKTWFGPAHSHMNTKDIYVDNCIKI